MRRFAKPVSGVTCSEGSNPSLSAISRAPVAQWIEHLVADQKVVSSSLAGRATPPQASRERGTPLLPKDTNSPPLPIKTTCIRRIKNKVG